MVSHGVVVAALFLLIGVFYERVQTRQIEQVQGLAHSMPQFSTIFGIVMMCSLGLPLTMGFVGEVLCLYGFFQVNPIMAFLAGSSFFVGAIYMLVCFKKVFFGAALPKFINLKDLNSREKVVFIPVVILIVWLGVYPKPLLNPISTSAEMLSQTIGLKISESSPNTPVNTPEDFAYPPLELPQDFDDEGVLIIPKIGD